MKAKRILISIILILIIALTSMFILTACGEEDDNTDLPNVDDTTNDNPDENDDSTNDNSTADADLIKVPVGNNYYIISKWKKEGVDIVIPSEIEGKIIVGLLTQAFENHKDMNSITLPASIKAVAENTFNGCNSLTKVNFIGTVSEWCEIELGDNPVAKSKLLYINDQLLTEVIIPEDVQVIKPGTFAYCNGITKVEIPNTVTTIGARAFANCKNLESVTIGDAVNNIGNEAFYNCTKLKNIVIPALDLEVEGNDIFKNCPIEKASLHKDSFELISKENLKEITILGEGLLEYTLFNGCTKLKKLTITNGITDVKYMGFFENLKLTCVEYLGTIEEWCEIKFDHQANFALHAEELYIDGEIVTELVLPESVTTINARAFNGFTSLTRVVLPSTIKNIGDSAFEGCVNLTEISLPFSLESIGMYAFSQCSKLENIVLPEGVQSIGYYAFDQCSKLDFNLKENINYLGSENNPYLVAMEMVDKTQATVNLDEGCRIIYSNAFKNCTNISNVAFSDEIIEIGNEAFMGCRALESVNFGSAVQTIGASAFCECESLSNVIIPDSVINLGLAAFENCSNLTSVTIGDSVKSIGSYTFMNCTNLTNVIVGNSVKEIGNFVFWGSAITSIVIPESVELLGETMFPTTIESVVFEDVSTWYKVEDENQQKKREGGVETDITSIITNGFGFWYKL